MNHTEVSMHGTSSVGSLNSLLLCVFFTFSFLGSGGGGSRVERSCYIGRVKCVQSHKLSTLKRAL